jgi:peptidoglycan-associated lipoprotein
MSKLLVTLLGVSLLLTGCMKHRRQGHSRLSNPYELTSETNSYGLGESEAIGGSSVTDQARDDVRAATYHFNFDSSKIHEADKVNLLNHANYLRSHPNAKLLLAGHTDEIGSREYNVALGERRAKSVLDFLRFSGVNGRQLRVLSYGQEKPKALGHDEAAHRLNRRVELSYEAS